MDTFAEWEDFTAVIEVWRQGRLNDALKRLRMWAARNGPDRLSASIELLQHHRAFVLLPEVLYPLIARLQAQGKPERAAYHLNDLGIFLRDSGDLRAITCFHQALKLTRDKGRRIRTLRRLGDIYVVLLHDAGRARRHYMAAIRAGEQAGDKPTDTEQWGLIHRLKELGADEAGFSEMFARLRRDARAATGA